MKNETVKTNKVGEMVVTFHTNGGPQKVEIVDERLRHFILATKEMKDQYGGKPNHPFDYISIAEQLCDENILDEEAYNYYENAFMGILKNFKYKKD